MTRGAIWKLNTRTLGVYEIPNDRDNTQRVLVSVPAGTYVTIADVPNDGVFVKVQCRTRQVFLFRVDLRERGEQVC